MTPEETLAAARALLERPDPATAGLWPRAASLLARQTLEASMLDYWESKSLGVGGATMRTQLLCLQVLVPGAEDAGHLWDALSRVCHHHPYLLPPTSRELLGWLEAVDRIRRLLQR